MKTIGLVLLVIFFISCSKDDNNDRINELANVVSSDCATIKGPTAAYWNYAMGRALPLSRVPVLANPGAQFIHSQHPYLGLTIPQGYSAFEAQDIQVSPLGVNVIRNDNAVVWRYVPLSTFPGNFTVESILQYEIDGMLNNFGMQGTTPTILCHHLPSVVSYGGGSLQQAFTAKLVSFGNFTALVWINVTATQGLPMLNMASSISVGPSNEFDNLVMDIFLPLSFQLLVSDKDSLSDRDRDGTPDIYDSEPDNPLVQ